MPASPDSGAVSWRRTVQFTRLLALVGFFGLLVLAVMTALDITLRWLFDAPLHGVNDVSALVMAVVIAACLPANLAERQNITIEFLGNALGPRAKAALDAFGGLATLLFVALVAWRFTIYAREIGASGQTTAVLGLRAAPWWWLATALLLLSVPVQAMVVLTDLRRVRAPPDPGGNPGDAAEPGVSAAPGL